MIYVCRWIGRMISSAFDRDESLSPAFAPAYDSGTAACWDRNARNYKFLIGQPRKPKGSISLSLGLSRRRKRKSAPYKGHSALSGQEHV